MSRSRVVGAAAAALFAAVSLVIAAPHASANCPDSDPNCMGGGGNTGGGHRGGGGGTNTCPNGWTMVNYNGNVSCVPPSTSPPKTSPPASSFVPKTSTKSSGASNTPAPAGNFVTRDPAAVSPANQPTAAVDADAVTPGAGAAAVSPAADVNGKPISQDNGKKKGDPTTKYVAGMAVLLAAVALLTAAPADATAGCLSFGKKTPQETQDEQNKARWEAHQQQQQELDAQRERQQLINAGVLEPPAPPPGMQGPVLPE